MSKWVEAVLNTELESPESRDLGFKFTPRNDDVIIATPAKCGTTWMQQIVHGLRSRGSMDFDDMSLVIPCLEQAHSAGYTDLQADQGYLPRVYKTHFFFRDTPKGAGKYIVIVRDPVDAGLSFYNMFVGWVFPPGSVDVTTFLNKIYLPRSVPESHTSGEASIWQWILSWYPHRNDANVLFLHFEDMVKDLPAIVRLVAEFLQIGHDDPALQELVVNQSSFQFMKQHGSKFDERALKLARNEANGLPRDAGLVDGGGSKIRRGETGAAKSEMPPELQAAFLQRWKADVGTALGFDTYQDFRMDNLENFGRQYLL